jgi:hypothetical protein
MEEVPHSLDAIRVSQALANYFVDTARYSRWAYGSEGRPMTLGHCPHPTPPGGPRNAESSQAVRGKRAYLTTLCPPQGGPVHQQQQQRDVRGTILVSTFALQYLRRSSDR